MTQSLGDPCALIVLDWAIKSINFELDVGTKDKNEEGDAAEDEDDEDKLNKLLKGKSSFIYASYINIILINFDILNKPWEIIKVKEPLLELLIDQDAPSVCGAHSLLNLVTRLQQSVLLEKSSLSESDAQS